MPHELETMFYVGEIPWHKLGHRFEVGTVLTAEQAVIAAGLNWQVEKRSLRTNEGLEVKDFFAHVRVMDEKVLGISAKKYVVVQNIEAVKWFQPFLDQDLMQFESAGSLRSGRVIWVLAKLNADNCTIRKDDDFAKYLLLANSHDCSLPVRVGLTPVRVVCMNTLNASLNRGDHIISIRHTRNVQMNLKQVQDLVMRMNNQFDRVAEAFKYLASVDIDSEKLQQYIMAVFGKPDEQKESEQENDLENNSRILKQIVELFEQRNYGPKDFDTYWEAYNAITEYLTHYRGNELDKRLDSVWFGDSARLNRIAMHKALEMARK